MTCHFHTMNAIRRGTGRAPMTYEEYKRRFVDPFDNEQPERRPAAPPCLGALLMGFVAAIVLVLLLGLRK